MSNGSPDRIDNNPGLIPPLGPTTPQRSTEPQRTSDGKTFGDVLRTKVGQAVPAGAPAEAAPATRPSSLKWSQHAVARLHQRGIALSDPQMGRLESAVDKLAAKGARESLVLLDDNAMVVSVRNRTVITALSREQARENVFTNIDSAVIA